LNIIAEQMEKTMLACFSVPSYGLSFPLTPQSLASIPCAAGSSSADSAAMPCALCGVWIDRPQWRHFWYAVASGVPAASNCRYTVCIACSVSRNLELISQLAALVPCENLEDLNERLGELLAWIARHSGPRSARRQHRATQA
jgi:hypothetical protein